MIYIKEVNSTFIKVTSPEPHIEQELYDFFLIQLPPQWLIIKKKDGTRKKKLTNGKTVLYKKQTKLLYRGLLNYVRKFAEERNYSITYMSDFSHNNVSEEELREFIKLLKLPMEVRDYQFEAILTAVRQRRKTILSPTSCHAADDEIFMADNTVKQIQNVQIGDYVLGADGKKKEVLNLYRGRSELYKLVPLKKRYSPITVTGQHILPIKHSSKDYKDELISVDSFQQKSDWYKLSANMYCNNNPNLEYEQVEYSCKLPAYFIGLYLGDGSTHTCSITSADSEVVNYCRGLAESMHVNFIDNGRYNYKFTSKIGCVNSILNEFRSLGIYISNDVSKKITTESKFIPEVLFQQSVSNRFDLLAGLLDSDGYKSGNHSYQFVSKSKQLSDGVKRLALSLGLVANSYSLLNKKYNRYYHYVNIIGDTYKIPTKITRKISTKQNINRDLYRVKFKVEQIDGGGDFYGLEVQDHLYITNNGIVTHNSGKSLIIYVIMMFCMYKGWVKKPLIIAPTINLVIQMKGDFITYGCDPKLVHVIHYGHEKYSKSPIFISTWQSLVDFGNDYFNQFDMLIGDEAHGFEAKSLVSIATRMVNCHYKLGFTGTLKDTLTHRLIIEGIFGDQMRTITTRDMIDQGYAAKFKINIVVLNYPEKYRKKLDYQEELDFLLNYEPRQKFIKHLATQVEGSTLVLFQFVRKHGVELFNRIAEIDPEHTHFVYGGVPGDDREKIRKIIMESKSGTLLSFPFGKILIPWNVEVELSDGTKVLGKHLTIDSDISDTWLSINYEVYKYL